MQFFSDLRTNLSCVTVDCLTTCDDHVIADFFQSCSDDAGCSICIGTTEFSSGYQVSFITTHSQSFSQSNVSLRGAHGYYCYCAAQLFFQLQSCFDTCFVIVVDDRGNTVTDQCACLRIDFNFYCIGYLFNTYNDFHYSCSPSKFLVISFFQNELLTLKIKLSWSQQRSFS